MTGRTLLKTHILPDLLTAEDTVIKQSAISLSWCRITSVCASWGGELLSPLHLQRNKFFCKIALIEMRIKAKRVSDPKN